MRVRSKLARRTGESGVAVENGIVVGDGVPAAVPDRIGARRPPGLAVGVLALLVACSTGGDGDGDDGGNGITDPSNDAPTATIAAPADGATSAPGEAVTFEGSADDPEDGALTGASLAWDSDRDGPLGTGERITVTSLSEGAHTVTLTATDSDGATGTATVSHTVVSEPPTVTITAPSDGAAFVEGEEITFEGGASDPEDGTLLGPSLVWESDLDGQIGIGETFSRTDLSAGDHAVTLTATDSDGNAASDAVSISVSELAAGRAYVIDGVSGEVAVIDVGSSTVETTFSPAVSPSRVAVRPDGTTAYFLDGGSPSVASDDGVVVVDVPTRAVETTIPAPFAAGLAVTPDGREALVTGLDPDQNQYVTWVVDLSSNTVESTLTVGSGAGDVAISPDGSLAYVVNELDETLSVINVGARQVATTIPLDDPGQVPVPVAVTFAPDGNTAYVANSGRGEVAVVDVTTSSVTDWIPVGDTPFDVAVTPDGAAVYVANFDSNDISVIDPSSGTVTATIPVESSPRAVAVHPDGEIAYVLASGVTVIDVAANQVSGSFPVGSFQVDVAFIPPGTGPSGTGRPPPDPPR